MSCFLKEVSQNWANRKEKQKRKKERKKEKKAIVFIHTSLLKWGYTYTCEHTRTHAHTHTHINKSVPLQQTGIHDPGGFRMCTPSKRATAETHLKSRGHWHRSGLIIRTEYCLLTAFFYVLEILPAETVRKDMVTEKLLKIPLFVYKSTGKHLKKYRYHTSSS